MGKKTKKVHSAGRYGVRYGVGIRRRILKVERKQKQKHACPDCGFERVGRTAAGLFSCSKCGCTFAGGAYTPKTMTGGIVRRVIAQKTFGQGAEELLEINQESPATPIKAKTESPSAKDMKNVLAEQKGTISPEKEEKMKTTAQKGEEK